MQCESRPRIGPPRTNGRAGTARAVSARRSRSSPASSPAARAAFPGAQLSAALPARPAARPGARALPPPPCSSRAHGTWADPLRCCVFQGLMSSGDRLSRPDKTFLGRSPASASARMTLRRAGRVTATLRLRPPVLRAPSVSPSSVHLLRCSHPQPPERDVCVPSLCLFLRSLHTSETR